MVIVNNRDNETYTKSFKNINDAKDWKVISIKKKGKK